MTSMSNVTRKSNDTDIDIFVDPLLWFIDMLKDRSNRQDQNKVMLDFYKEETILASKICLHERLNNPGHQGLKRYNYYVYMPSDGPPKQDSPF